MFTGFQPADFETIKGTTWRSRKGFAGDVIDHIGSDLQAWAVYGWQGFQIGPKRDGKPVPESAKLFVNTAGNEVDGNGVAYGLYVECDQRKKNSHWQNLVDGLREERQMKKSLAIVIKKHDVTFGKYAGSADNDPKWRFQSAGGRLYRIDGKKRVKATLDDLIKEIVKLPKGKWVDFYVYSYMSQEAAIAAGESVTERVSALLLSLVPFYFQIRYRRLTTSRKKP